MTYMTQMRFLKEFIQNHFFPIKQKFEFKSNIYPSNYEEELYKLQNKGVTPIIAHPERYRFIKNDYNKLCNWIDRGYVLQVDSGSILGQFGKETQRLSLKMVDSGYIHLIDFDECLIDTAIKPTKWTRLNKIYKKPNSMLELGFNKKNPWSMLYILQK